MVEIPTIEPFQFIRSTAFSERVQLANKINEIIDGINQIGDIPDLENQITKLTAKVTELEESIGNTDTSLAELENQVNALISEVNTTIKQSISALESEVDGIDTRLKTAEGTISEHGTEIDGLLKEVIDGVVMTSSPHGTVQVQINHEDGSNDISAPIDLGLGEEGGIVLQSGTTDRSFKLIVTLTDGTSWQTNDFVIPEGGGTEVSVTSISIAQGTGSNKIQVKIGLSDGSTISSNDWTVVTPTQFSALGTRVTTAEGNITKNTGDISDLDSRVQTLEDSPGFTLKPATATALGGVKIGAGITVQSDGTISVDKTQIDTAAVASTVKFTADGSKVTLHADSVGGSEFTKDIPQASQGGAGTIDQESYAKIAATESKVNALALTKPSSNQMSINNTTQDIIDTITGRVDETGNLILTINGKSGSGIPLPKGETIVEIPPYVLTDEVPYVDYIGGTGYTNTPYLVPSDEDFFIVGTGKFKTKASFTANNYQIANYYQGNTQTMRKITEDIFGDLGLEDGTYYTIVGNMFSLYHFIAGDRSPAIPKFTISNGEITTPINALYYVHEDGGNENLHAGDTVFCTLLIKQ